MRYWDSSALVPLILQEASTPWAVETLREDPTVAVWVLTRTEVTSAIFRKVRMGDLDERHVAPALERLDGWEERWNVVDRIGDVRRRAERLLAVHALTGGPVPWP